MFELPTKEELIRAGCPYGTTAYGNIPYGREGTEWLRTAPDSVVYIPDNSADGGNEQIQVIEVPGRDCLFAAWHQDSLEGIRDCRIMYSRSRDGRIWEEAKLLAGCPAGMGGAECMALYPYSIASPSGRIYVLYSQETEATRGMHPGTGIQMCRYTDDCGDTWSGPVQVPRNKSAWELNEETDIKCMFPIKNPIALRDGRHLCAYSLFVDPGIFPYQDLGGIACSYALTYFAIFENIASDPKPGDLQITWLPDDLGGIHLLPDNDAMSSCQEPCTVQLPNGWLFVTLRNFHGCIYYSVSEDMGHTWREPKPMRYADGELFVNPDATPMIFEYEDGKYVQLYYGRFGGLEKMFDFRERVLRTVGVFAPEEEQPIRFDRKAEPYMAVEVAAGPRKYNMPEVNLEASFTRFRGEPMLWYGDRKHYVLGKKL